MFHSKLQSFHFEVAPVTIQDQKEWTRQVFRMMKKDLLEPLIEQILIHPTTKREISEKSRIKWATAHLELVCDGLLF